VEIDICYRYYYICNMAAESDHIIRFNYTGEDEVPPNDATHVTVDQSVTVISAWAFDGNPRIIEVIGPNVEKVEEMAFANCPSLRRVIMPDVEVVKTEAFIDCKALTDIEFGKLEIIGREAFRGCESLGSINLPSTKIVEDNAFPCCEALTEAIFGSKLETIEEGAFYDCRSLERITIPLKDGLITRYDSIFSGCENLVQVDLVEGEVHETIAALQLEEWRNDMNEEIDSINQILPTVSAGGGYNDVGEFDEGEKAQAIRTWIRSVLRKIVHYQAEQQRLLDEEVATTLQLALPQDIVMNNVLPFVYLPSCTFEVGDD